MFFKINDKKVVADIKRFKKSIPKAGELASRAVADKVAERIKERVKRMIPNEGGWYDIYRDSVKVIRHGPNSLVVEATVSEIKFGRIPAASSLIWVSSSGDRAASVLSHHNPWTLDTIPAIQGGFTGDLTVRPASESECDVYRRKRRLEMNTVLQQLVSVNAAIARGAGELPRINGRIIADVPFLVQRLEHGLGGFPRVPIWSLLDQEGSKIIQSKSVRAAGASVFAARWRGKK
jgi:hypothetical protein